MLVTQRSHLKTCRSIEEKTVKKRDDAMLKLKQNTYSDYSEKTREVLIDRIL
jgi:hypothetical protein